MASKQVDNLGKLGLRVAATTSDPGRNDRATQGLIERCGDVVPPGTVSLTLSAAQYYVGRQIEVETEWLRRSDNDHVKSLLGENDRRQERDAAMSEVYAVMLRTGRGFEVVFGKGSSKTLLGLDTRIPDNPRQLYQTADRCRSWLRDESTRLPEPELPGFRFDREAMAAAIDLPLDRLGAAITALPADEKHSMDTLVVKMERMNRLDRLIGRGARLMEALYDIAGMEEESDRVRQSSHRAETATPEPETAAEPASETAEAASETAEAASETE